MDEAALARIIAAQASLSRSVCARQPVVDKAMAAPSQNLLTADMTSSESFTLTVTQQPRQGKVYQRKDKDRKPIEPPPVVELGVNDHDPYKNFLSSPYFFMVASLHEYNAKEGGQERPCSDLAGTHVSSLHRVKDTENSDVGYFVFQDISVRKDGNYRLQFSLFEMQMATGDATVKFIKDVFSQPFTVYSGAKCPPPMQSTQLTKHLQEQGVKLRTKKTPNAHGRRSRRPEDWSSSLPRPDNGPALDRGNLGHTTAEMYPSRLAPAPVSSDDFRRNMGHSVPQEKAYSYPDTSGTSTYSTTASTHNPSLRNDEPRQKRQRPNSSFPDVENRLVLPSNKPTYGQTEEAGGSTTGHYGEGYSNHLNYPTRTDDPRVSSYPASLRRANPWAEASPYASHDPSRSNLYGQRSYQTPAEAHSSVPAQTNMHLPTLANLAASQAPSQVDRFWSGYDGNNQYPNPYDSGRSSNNSGSIPNILPPPTAYNSRAAVENGTG